MIKKQKFITIKLICISKRYDHWLFHNSPKHKACVGIVSILRQSTFMLCKLTRNAHFHTQTGFTFWTAVRSSVVIFSWHRHQFNCYELLLLNHCTNLKYHGHVLISYYLNFVDIFFFLTNEPLGKMFKNEMVNGQLWVYCISNNIFICWLRLAENSVLISLAITRQ